MAFLPLHWLRSDPYSYFETSFAACACNLERRVLNSLVFVVDKIMTRQLLQSVLSSFSHKVG